MCIMKVEAGTAKLEIWKMQRCDFVCIGWRQKWHELEKNPLGGVIHPATAGLWQWKRSVADFPPNSAKMLGGHNKAEYKRLINLVSQNRMLYDATCIRL